MFHTAVQGDEVRALSPAIAWPTLILTAFIVPLHLAMLALGLSGQFSPWWLTLPLGISAYVHYTPAHEAIHRNIVHSHRFDPANAAIGWWSAILTGMTWPLLARTHVAHHAHTNSDRDPDIFVRGSLPRLFAMAVISIVTNLVPLPFWRLVYGRNTPNLGYLDAWKVMPAHEWRVHQAVHAVMCLGVWTAVATGHGVAVFALYVVPATIGRLMIGIFLSWVPHAPFNEGDRYRIAPLRRNRWLAILAIGHHIHLVHHLWPRVPFYRYPALYRRMAPILREHGVKLI